MPMAPSRGGASPRPSSSSSSSAAAAAQSPSDEAAVTQQGDSALVAVKRNMRYLLSPTGAGDHPARLRTRALLRLVRAVSIFIFWRVVRYAKYVAVGAMAAAIGATAFGSVVTGVAWIAAPTTLGASIAAGTLWTVGKWGARRLHRRWQRSGGDLGEEMREREPASPVRRDGTVGIETGPAAMPW